MPVFILSIGAVSLGAAVIGKSMDNAGNGALKFAIAAGGAYAAAKLLKIA